MAFDVRLAERVRRALAPRRDVEEKRMFGGIAFMVQGHMACGIVGSSLMVRLDHEMAAASLRRRHVRPMDFTGKPMRGFLYVDAPGIATTAKLRDWVRRATAHAESLPVKGATPTPTRSAARTGTGGRARTPVVSTRRPTGEALRATIKRRGAD